VKRKVARIRNDILDTYRLQALPAREFKAKFISAMRGEENEFSPFIKPLRNDRLPWSEWKEIREIILHRDHYACTYCCDDADEVDHIYPHSRGGSDSIENLTSACRACNASKGDLTPEEWCARDDMKLPPWWDDYFARLKEDA
jgi:hypothetical protein